MSESHLINGAVGSRDRAAQHRRTPRGRIILLGDEALVESVARFTPRPTTLAHHMYDVIGELVQTGVLDAPDAIVASIEVLGARAEPFVQAVRRIDPNVELVGVVSNGAARPEWTTGFDAVLRLPLDSESLERAISGAGCAVVSQDDDADAIDPQSTAASNPVACAAIAPSGPLGDVDLVAALLRHPEQVRAMALRLVEQETGWRALRIDAAPSRTAAGAEICAPAEGDHQVSYGWLVAAAEADSAVLTAERLKPWADWMAHWLQLARSMSDLREKAYTDQLTGAYNRRFFEQYMGKALDDARLQRQCVSLLLFDIDDFKHYNDAYGHAAGDEILIETVKLLRSVIRPNDRVCRIGGDEFVVIFHDPQGQRERGSSHPDDIQQIARRFQQQICQHRFPKLSADARGTLTISGGLATFPWDGADAASLLEQADRNAMASKRSGKNAITFGPGAGNGSVAPDGMV